MPTSQEYQTLEKQIQAVSKQTASLAFMNREQIFEIIATLISLSDSLNNYVRKLDLEISQAEDEVINAPKEGKVNASMLGILIKQKTSPYKANRDWAERQIAILRDLRIAALSAQRAAEY